VIKGKAEVVCIGPAPAQSSTPHRLRTTIMAAAVMVAAVTAAAAVATRPRRPSIPSLPGLTRQSIPFALQLAAA
jgi:hypothetical protein